MDTTHTAPPPPAVSFTYASFGSRFAAWIIDVIVIVTMQFVVIMPLMGVLGFGIVTEFGNTAISDEELFAMIMAIIAGVISVAMLGLAISVLYYALMESSKSQASVGKMAVGIKVTDMNGQRISFGRALMRNVGKLISGMILYVGYLMAAFTDKRQGLHDLLASTLVIKK